MVLHRISPPPRWGGSGGGDFSAVGVFLGDHHPTPCPPHQGEGDFSAGFTYGLNAPPGTAEATGLSKPSSLTDETPSTQSSTRTERRTCLMVSGVFGDPTGRIGAGAVLYSPLSH